MAQVEWIKIRVDTFEDEKIRLIESLPEGDALIVIWFKLLAQAGKTNDGGYIYLKEGIPYTSQMLSVIFNRPQTIIDLALKTFVDFGMIEITEKGIFIVNWQKHQNVDGLERIREQTRERVRKYRERKKQEQLQLPAPEQQRCGYCGDIADTIEHIIPKSKGGTDEPYNLIPCCKSCNSSKHDKDLVDFLNDSLNSEFSKVKLDVVLNNEKLMRFVEYSNGVFRKRYSNVTVTDGNALDKDKEEDKEKDKERDRDKEKRKDSLKQQKLKQQKENLCSFEDVQSFVESYSASNPLPIDKTILTKYIDCLRLYRKTARISTNVIKTQWAKWSNFPPVVVEYAMRVHLAKHDDKPEEYTLAIMRNTNEHEASRKLILMKNRKGEDLHGQIQVNPRHFEKRREDQSGIETDDYYNQYPGLFGN